MRGSAVLFLLLAVLTVAVNAGAQDVEHAGDQYRHDPVAIEGHLTPFGGPFGMAGVALDVALVPQLSLTGGLGAGGFGPQWAAGIKPRIPVTPHGAVSFSLLYSRGDYKQFTLDAEGINGAYLFRGASWGNLDVGYEWRFRSHILIRPSIGASQLFASRTPVWHESGGIRPNSGPIPGNERWPLLFYVGVALGFDVGPDS
jgi:hypothetical protein